MSELFLSIGERGTSVDELNLDDATNYLARPDGLVDNGDGTLTLPLGIFGADADAMVAARRAVLRMLDLARQASGPNGVGTTVTLGFRHNTTDIVFYDILGGVLRTERQYPGGDTEEAVLELEHTGKTRSASIVGTPTATITTLDTPILIADVDADVESARARLTLTDVSTVGAINKLRIGRVHADTATAADFDPLVNVTALSGATLVDVATITTSSIANPTTITTSAPHDFANGDVVTIAGHSGSTPSINGVHTVTFTGASTFTIPVNVTTGGTGGTATPVASSGTFVRRSLTPGSGWLDLCRAVMPAGALNKGRRDLWALVKDDAQVIGPPTGLGSAVNAPPGGGGSPPSRRQFNTANNGAGGTSVSVTPSLTTLADSMLALAVKAVPIAAGEATLINSETNSGTAVNATVAVSPASQAGNTLIVGIELRDDVLNALDEQPGWIEIARATNPGANSLVVLMRPNAASVSGTLTFPIGPSTGFVIVYLEYAGLVTVGNPVVSFFAHGLVDSSTSSSVSFGTSITTLPEGPTLWVGFSGAWAADGNGPATQSWGGSFTERADVSATHGNLSAADLANDGGHMFVAVTASESSHWTQIGVGFAIAPPPAADVEITPPAGYTMIETSVNLEDPFQPVKVALMVRPGAPATAAAQTVNFSAAVLAQIAFAEYLALPDDDTIDVSGGRITSGGTLVSVSSEGVTDEDVFVGLAAFAAFDSRTFASYTGGFTEVSDSGGLALAQLIGTVRQQLAANATASAGGSQYAAVCAAFVQRPPEEGETPGDLAPGTYETRVVGFGAAGNRSNATASHSPVVAVAGSSITYSWSAGAGAVSFWEVYVSIGGIVYRFATPGSATGFVLTSLADGFVVLALPLTTGAVAVPGWIRARVGTTGGALTGWGSARVRKLGVWHLVQLGAYDLPPVAGRFNDERPDWTVEFQSVSAGGAAGNFSMDALLLFAHDEPQLRVWPVAALAAPAPVWIIEQRPDGRIAAWLEDGGGNEVGRLNAVGELSLARGDNLLHVLAEQAADVVHLTDAAFTLQVDYAAGLDAQAGDIP